jgi:hypothetical protein
MIFICSVAPAQPRRDPDLQHTITLALKQIRGRFDLVEPFRQGLAW